jgi:hypothetical protein
VVLAVLARLDRGESARAVALATGIPYETIRKWQRGRIPRKARRTAEGTHWCADCGAEEHDFSALPGRQYAYLLGIYLGDGCLYRHTRGTYGLKVTLDEAYPWIVISVADAIDDVRGRRPSVSRPRRDRCMVVTSYSRSWPCLFPQHGRGRKHDRRIELTSWQQQIVRTEPECFLRGLIHSDGWRGLNRVKVKGRWYAYPRYQFSNRSHDIRTLFTDTCDLLGVQWRPWGRYHISVARRDSVARLDSFIGPKC